MIDDKHEDSLGIWRKAALSSTHEDWKGSVTYLRSWAHFLGAMGGIIFYFVWRGKFDYWPFNLLF